MGLGDGVDAAADGGFPLIQSTWNIHPDPAIAHLSLQIGDTFDGCGAGHAPAGAFNGG